MNHPESLLVPGLMLSDYILTVAGARLRTAYAKHFKTPSYELNPLWQVAVAQRRWFNWKHLALTALVGALVIWLSELSRTPDPTVAYVLSLVFGVQGMINGRHLGNLATFAYLRRHPEQLSGEVIMSHEFTLWLSLFQTAAVLVPVALLLIPTPTPRTLGAFTGVVGIALVHLIWLWRHKSRQTSL